ncbi:unnamed protein product [Linum tenue]|uniref:arogenate dehydratase n=1 Tax=Linum tenue TaxID=586396 RepID=A0AAV0HTA3_9ROSI|nr:unnamed protein product [Linum tenue]
MASARMHDSGSGEPRLRVAYQGVSGAYSEAAAQKAYPNSEAVPCDQFETAFEAVEGCTVDRAVLPIENSLGFQTSIVFSLEEGPGILYKALQIFAKEQINLTKIESRPWRRSSLRSPGEKANGLQKCFHYMFYVDFEASMASDNAQNALKALDVRLASSDFSIAK